MVADLLLRGDPVRSGRPPVTGETRGCRIYLRVSRSEREQIAAAVPKGKTESQWLREAIRAALAK